MCRSCVYDKFNMLHIKVGGLSKPTLYCVALYKSVGKIAPIALNSLCVNTRLNHRHSSINCSFGILKDSFSWPYKTFSTCTTRLANEGNTNDVKTQNKIGKDEVGFNEFECHRMNGSALIVDVRNSHELQENGDIPNIINIPLRQIPNYFYGHHSAGDFKEEFGAQKPNKDDAIIFFCKKGIRAEMARKLLTLNAPAGHVYKNVASYPGSFDEWSEFSSSKDNSKLK